MATQRNDRPTSIRLAPEDLARADSLRRSMAKAASIDEGGVSRHVVLLAAVKLGLDVLEKRHGTKRTR